MAKRKLGKNTLPLLAITALVLSVALVNYDKSLVSNSNSTQSVLSESDENKVEEVKKEEKKEDIKQVEQKEEKRKEEKKEKKQEKVETKINAESAQKITTGKIKVDEIKDVNEVKDDIDIDNDKDKTDDKTKTESEFEQESETVSSDGTVNKFKFKLKTRTVNGKTIIETAKGEMEVKSSPRDSVDNLVNNGILDTPTSFEAKTNDNNKIEFEVQGVEVKKLLGLFEVSLPKTVTIDSETGNVIDTNQSIWTQLLSLLSIK